LEDVAKKEIEDRLIEFYNTYCTDQINEMYVSYPQKRSIAVNMKDLAEFDGELTSELINNLT
jgi:N-acetyl-beta-hexosaminidase